MEGTETIDSRVTKLASEANMIIDAIFGTGLTGTLRDEYKRLIDSINELGCPVLSVDIPSGLDCDTGLPLGASIKANCTVTFVAAKKGFVFENTKAYTGDIFVASIGVEPLTVITEIIFVNLCNLWLERPGIARLRFVADEIQESLRVEYRYHNACAWL